MSWMESLIWTDYRLAIVFAILAPLILLLWAFIQRNDPIQLLMVIYFRVASLMAITVYLMIAAMPLSFIAALAARVLVLISLWFWVDLNEEIDEQLPDPLKFSFVSWRWLISFYHGLGTIALVPFLRCAFVAAPLQDASCRIWLDPPWLFKSYFHADADEKFLGLVGFVGLLVYAGYLSYFVLVKLNRQGRSALEN